MMPSCPACGHQVRPSDLPRGSFPCPWCKEKLRLPGTSRVELSIIAGATLIVSFDVLSRLGPRPFTLFLLVVGAPILQVGFRLTWAIFRILFFPQKLRRDAGWGDEGTILHITSPPEPPERE
jgi:hypothetical protein